MYQVVDVLTLVRSPRSLLRRGEGVIPRTVLLLGLTSLLTDVSSEMVATVLPVYVVSVLGLSPLQFGIVDGLHQGAAAVVRLAAGYVGDRTGAHKRVAVAGYGLSAVCRIALVLVGGAWGAIVAIVAADRVGKGIRTAPRDAMISLGTRPEHLGAAFGVHRALDTTGAMIGPLVAFGLLALAPGSFSALFVLSFCFALLGLAVLVFLVDGRGRAGKHARPERPPSITNAAGLLARPRVRALTVTAGLLALVTVSDGFVYLHLQRELDLDLRWVPLLFVGSAATYMVLSVPLGRLADRIGRGRVFLGGYALLACLYGLLLSPAGGPVTLAAALLLVGTVAAATDGVLMALASASLPEELRGSGLALVGTATNLARLGASITFGALWATVGVDRALLVFLIALAVATVGAAVALRRTRPAAEAATPCD